MKNLPLLFCGIFFTLAFSWTGIVLVNHLSYGSLQPYRDESDGGIYPERVPGSANAGREEYRKLGCVYCHSQQVRTLTIVRTPERMGDDGKVIPAEIVNPDIERGWGNRASVARDYIREPRVYLGTMRTGPDLRNVGARRDANWNHLHLYYPELTTKGSIMPPYPFLYEKRRIVGEPSPRALKIDRAAAEALGMPEAMLPEEGYEIVPTQRAENLVAYLVALNDSYENYPEVTAPGSVKR